MEYLQRGLMSHGLDPGGVKPLDASVPRASGEVAGLGPSRNPSSSMVSGGVSTHDERSEFETNPLRFILNLFAPQPRSS